MFSFRIDGEGYTWANNRAENGVAKCVISVTSLKHYHQQWSFEMLSLCFHVAGPIPEALGALSNLQSLWITNTRVNGEGGVFLLRNQVSISLVLVGGERFPKIGPSSVCARCVPCAGSIPTALGALRKLKVLSLHNNHLSGE